MRLFLRMYLCIGWFTTASTTLLMTESRDTGRYFDGSALESFLCAGVTDASFHWPGKMKRRHRGLAGSGLRSLRTLVGIGPGPEALSGFRPFKSLLMSFGLKAMLSNVQAVVRHERGKKKD